IGLFCGTIGGGHAYLFPYTLFRNFSISDKLVFFCCTSFYNGAYILNSNEKQLILLFSFTSSYFDYTSIKTLKKFLRRKKHPRIWMITGGQSNAPSFVHRTLRFSSK
ncbi:hypothetical protein, partial [Streptococcus sobrinus]|uniref:hypothetical protein n=1 Tax=Streptococcus sobrinus TaxID=1310 RepID=UPI0039C4AB3F